MKVACELEREAEFFLAVKLAGLPVPERMGTNRPDTNRPRPLGRLELTPWVTA